MPPIAQEIERQQSAQQEHHPQGEIAPRTVVAADRIWPLTSSDAEPSQPKAPPVEVPASSAPESAAADGGRKLGPERRRRDDHDRQHGQE